jgi:L-aspartate oxidase
VYLDMRAAGVGVDLKARFPGISEFLGRYELELGRDLIPVRPAAHYMMGGIRTDVQGRTSVPGLFAAGEAACTGVHGANRLASNSLLEGLVFGALAAEEMVKQLQVVSCQLSIGGEGAGNREQGTDVEAWVAELRAMMWREAGLLRDAAGLRRAQAGLAAMRETMPQGLTRRAVEARNLLTLAEVMMLAALGREESRGAHFRTDFPEKAHAALHSVVVRGELRLVA